MKHEKGVALLIVMMMILLFTIVGGGVMLYSRSSTEVAYREVRKVKAYYAAEAGLQRGFSAVYSGVADGTYPWQISVGEQWVGDDPNADPDPIPMTYTISTDANGTRTVTCTVSNISNIRLYFSEA